MSSPVSQMRPPTADNACHSRIESPVHTVLTVDSIVSRSARIFPSGALCYGTDDFSLNRHCQHSVRKGLGVSNIKA
ncbi:uncharacterized protein YALI1_A13397g [Yarrowia lipolytica]|uniref:Uncharacterized protein n=1 Tax=Yarrowia lipolytica TaxID=4952 RepID=A0A1D8N4M9_YARLL|nr:hypothetical protein YALI1_A13397g [Yarrowia lipolytica]